MTSNFQFLQTEWPEVFRDASEAEKLAVTSPKASCVLSRSALEVAVNWLYDNDSYLEYPYKKNLNDLIHAQCFKDILKPSMHKEINLIKYNGNKAAHSGAVVRSDVSILSLKNLFRFLSFLGLYYSEQEIELPVFSSQYIPDGNEQQESKKTIQLLEQQLELRNSKAKEKQEKLYSQAEEIKELKEQLLNAQKEITKRRETREKVTSQNDIPELISEAKTRKLYIDILLKDAGWDNLQMGRELEYEVTNCMPKTTNPTGKGFVDYVLWGKDGKPLAVIEAKKTMVDARSGKHQAELYANCLEQKFAQRPIIFYTNGFETYLWDDTFYIDREVSGFYTQDELQLLIDRRSTRKDLHLFSVNKDIAGRDYQIEAIQRVAENFVTTNPQGQLKGTHRKSLLVMATGSGKTRTSAAIVDMLTRSNWVKRVLFLADRNALVSQAKNAFKEHVPHLSSIDLTKEKEDKNTRLVFSTYPTIMNKIDAVKTNNERFYGVGHFDLIIIDEAHRSVYKKYKAIFDYFDTLLIGLTATPKKDIDHNTYGLFDIQDDNPTFAYELNTAVEQGYLVPPKAISVPLKFQREGIKYSELSAKEKQEYEEKFGDPSNAETPDVIGSAALNKWLFNIDTVDKVLDYLMTNGIKVDGGDKLGKTIIFAKNHDHALFIEERFNKNYPQYSGKFLRVIDNYESKAQSLLEKFTNPFLEENPQIAVSVDMMDTGVDAPRVVNLVFFKMVKSASKFWQMIGRGTRLCPDLFAPGVDKKEFLIFDYCQNFEFFEEFPDGYQSSNTKPLQQQIFELKLEISQLITQIHQPDQFQKELCELYLNELHGIISSLDSERFEVRKQLRYVQKYSERAKWNSLDKSDIQEIRTHLSNLQPVLKEDDELARRFDVLVLSLQKLILIGSSNIGKAITNIHSTAAALEKKDNIPQVAAHLPLLKLVQTEHYWETINVKKLEDLRVSIRSLVKYLDQRKQAPVYTNFEDELDKAGVKVTEPVSNSYISLQSYKDRVETYIRNHRDHLVIHKLRNNVPITAKELEVLEQILFTEDVAGSKEDFQNQYGDKPLGAFIRSITGVSQEALNIAFADFLQVGNLRADQMTFVKTIISYLSKNGTIEKTMLYEPPFTDLNDQGISGVFDNDTDVIRLVRIIDSINTNAEVS